jgi:hypothetical protein
MKSPILFNQALNKWHGTVAEEIDLIDPNLSFVNTKQVDTWVKASLNYLISKAIEISNKLDENFNNYDEIQQKLSNEFEKILPNFFPNSIYRFNFDLSKSPLHILFFDNFEIIYNNFEKDLNDLMQSNEVLPQTFEILWKNFIKNILDIYIIISDTFWKNTKKSTPTALRRMKIKAAKKKLLSEAQKIQEIESNTIHTEQLEQPNQKRRKIYNLMNGIPGLQNISGKYFIFIKLKLFLK